jgi:hypothetical protein
LLTVLVKPSLNDNFTVVRGRSDGNIADWRKCATGWHAPVSKLVHGETCYLAGLFGGQEFPELIVLDGHLSLSVVGKKIALLSSVFLTLHGFLIVSRVFGKKLKNKTLDL